MHMKKCMQELLCGCSVSKNPNDVDNCVSPLFRNDVCLLNVVSGQTYKG